MDLHVGVEHLVQIKDLDTSADGHAHRVANKIAQMMIADKFFVLGEERTLGRIFDVSFERDQTFFAGLLKQLVHHLEGVDITLLMKF